MTDKARKSKFPQDANRLAKSVVDAATQEIPDPGSDDLERPKNRAAVSLGRRGGLKGGKARAASLTAEQRAEIARKAALSRWKRDR